MGSTLVVRIGTSGGLFANIAMNIFGFTKRLEILEQLSDLRFLKEDSAPIIMIISIILVQKDT
jgi:hypothetical protein